MSPAKLKPLSRALRGPVLLRRSSRVLSRALEEELFQIADVLSEGSCRTVPAAHDSYFGSTMLSFDLSRLRAHFRGGYSEQARRDLAWAIEGSIRVRLRAMRIACAEASRRVPDRLLGTALCEIRVRLVQEHLHIDVDLEVPLGVSSGSRQR